MTNREALQQLIDEILIRRCPHLFEWAIKLSPITLAIVRPENVRDEWHRIVHDHSLRERAREILRTMPDRVCVDGPNGVLILCPAQ